MIRVRSFSASSAQKGLWLAQKMSPETLNNALVMWDVDGELDTAVMESAFRHVMGEAEVLRLNFVDDGSGLRQILREPEDWQPFALDVSAAADPEQAARDALADVVGKPFDLERDLLLRLGTVRLSPARSLVVIAYHHLVSDGYGAGGLLSRRLAEVYTALIRDAPIPELPHPWDIESFAAEAAEYRGSEAFADDTEFWRGYLTDAPAPAQVPRIALSDAARAALSEPTGRADRWSRLAGSIGMSSRTLTVPRAEADAWTESAKSLGVWMSSLLAAAAAVFLRHRCDRPELLFSLAVANRGGAAVTTPGMAANVVPLRVAVPLGATFTEIADTVVDEMYKILGHTACHYSDIQQASGVSLNGRGNFGAVLNVVEFAEQLHFDTSPARHLGATVGAFDELAIGVYTDGTADSDLHLRLDAPESLYSGAELRFIGEELITYIRAVLDGPELPVGALDLLTGPERDRVLTAPELPDDPHGPEPTVPDLFAQQVARDPGATAVVCGDTELSYRELDERSSRVARALRRRGVGPETVVAVALPRSADLVVALLGVAKAGGVQLPVDPAAPAVRTGPAAGGPPVGLLLTDPATAGALPAGEDVPTLLFDSIRPTADTDTDTYTDNSVEGVRAEPGPLYGDGLLALVYGSGAAGTTPTAGVTHRNIRRFVTDPRWREGARGTVLWHAPPTSDALALEVWAPLLNGGRIVVAPPDGQDADALTGLCEAHGITTVRLPAGLFSAIAAERPHSLAGLREVWTGGDRVSAAAVRRVREACPGLTLVIGHGPAEATGFAAARRLTADEPEYRAGTVGRPMDGTALYVLGPGLAPVPEGVTGELYVAGPGLARGLPGRPGPTAERFVPCPYGPPGGLMYRTGERVRRGTDGGPEYLGRADTQAEIRGITVDSAAIEEALAEHPGLALTVVAAGRDGAGQRRLAAYAVPAAARGGGDGPGVPTAEELRRFAAGRLPEFMVPSVFVVLERLPMTPGGRVDRAALPAPAFDDNRYRAPRDHTERVLAEAFADVLELDRIGIDQDFFDLGGNSLRAIRLVGLIRAELNFEVSIRTLFAARTIAGLSDMRKDLAPSSRPALRRRTQEGEVL
ncbi:non-ribosomal peptide synthetase [Streptomyces qinzhouensis]|uniref:AMP-binding protein n=1 Tax=Streptomyces qinzhouensis TaxID=2599401 RepID=A0A5B8IN67_9ACTN|nr:AMP-binding protein [Streptomyces qinzhouensis]QDY80098.1 AMP-binding protein [Streptomyces qinzhouensis]